ncbi:ABC transporter ATP-binding protein [Bacillus sp. AGMB 02131]|uniref:ABC transporter ATP-binding protein n=1 Tax=Peribacillus faecalis TaxID=2772559 RepID=A0A927CXZ3_9BACI|nr:ABC transporter ATP-binding protein [Peribacillus faecalis]MBD3109681.1 ABC transporter ATP-binding protein [Peribacillus faecalis]
MEYLLEVRGLCKDYNTFSLKNIDIQVPKGSIVGFIGENGAGKTTTIKAIIGAIHREQGDIQILGQPVDHQFEKIKQNIAVVMEGCFFYEDFTAHQIEKVLKGFYHKWNSEKFAHYLQKFKLPRDKKIKEFSKGMRMKLSLSIGLSYDAKLLILDEPTSGLDPIVRNEILDEFLTFIQDEERGILLSSHITSDLEKIADYITFIHEGEIVFTEMKDDLIYNYAVLKCGASEFERLDVADFIGYRKGEFQVEALVKDKVEIRQKYPDFVMDPVTIDDIMLFYVKGNRQ